ATVPSRAPRKWGAGASPACSTRERSRFVFAKSRAGEAPAPHCFISSDGRRLRFLLRQQSREPEVRQLLRYRVLSQPRAKIGEVDLVEVLILVEAGEDERLFAGRGIDVTL